MVNLFELKRLGPVVGELGDDQRRVEGRCHQSSGRLILVPASGY